MKNKNQVRKAIVLGAWFRNRQTFLGSCHPYPTGIRQTFLHFWFVLPFLTFYFIGDDIRVVTGSWKERDVLQNKCCGIVEMSSSSLW